MLKQLTGNSSSLVPGFLAYSNISGKGEARPVDSIAKAQRPQATDERGPWK
jgi:hypothetical protein